MSARDIISDLAAIANEDHWGFDLASAMLERLAGGPDDVFWRVVAEFWPNVSLHRGQRDAYVNEFRRRRPFADHLPPQSWQFFARLPEQIVAYQRFRRDRGPKDLCHLVRLDTLIPANGDLAGALHAVGCDAVAVVRFPKSKVLLACDEIRCGWFPVGIVVPDPVAVVHVGDADTVADLLDLAIPAEHASGKAVKPVRRARRGRQPAAHAPSAKVPTSRPAPARLILTGGQGASV